LAAESLDVGNHKSGNSHDISKKAKTIAKKPAKNVPVECATAVPSVSKRPAVSKRQKKSD
jgi:hypothetical protein